MADIKDYEPFRTMDEEVVREVIREAEARLQAQLSIATAADQRALTIAGFQIASASAALAGAGALLVGDKSYPILEVIAVCFAAVMLVATAIAIHTVRPKSFNIPGNRPKGWLPNNWIDNGLHGYNIKQARIEQAYCLDEAISDNYNLAAKNARLLRNSINITLWVVGAAAFLLASTVLIDSIQKRGSLDPVSAANHKISSNPSDMTTNKSSRNIYYNCNCNSGNIPRVIVSRRLHKSPPLLNKPSVCKSAPATTDVNCTAGSDSLTKRRPVYHSLR